MSLLDYIPTKFVELFLDPDFSKAIKSYNLYLLKEDKEYRKEVKNVLRKELDEFFDAKLATSELRPIKRIAELEQITGLDDFGLDDNHEPTIPERIQDLEGKLEKFEFQPTVSSQLEKEPTTKTELRASLLVDALKTSGKDHFTANEIIDFLKCKLPENCKISSTVKNIRKIKQDVIKAATEMFPNVDLNKKKTGHREVRLVLAS